MFNACITLLLILLLHEYFPHIYLQLTQAVQLLQAKKNYKIQNKSTNNNNNNNSNNNIHTFDSSSSSSSDSDSEDEEGGQNYDPPPPPPWADQSMSYMTR